jgi:hypothetical protein
MVVELIKNSIATNGRLLLQSSLCLCLSLSLNDIERKCCNHTNAPAYTVSKLVYNRAIAHLVGAIPDARAIEEGDKVLREALTSFNKYLCSPSHFDDDHDMPLTCGTMLACVGCSLRIRRSLYRATR